MKKAITIMFLVAFVGALAPTASAGRTRRPAHDDVAAASAVTAFPFSENVDLRGATLEPDERQPSCRAIRSSVWYALS
ncbi:MAG: hypothetical protein M3271_06830, partial [Actinomycetota bacterium]|nr:hypothetical protein [Actinomycetota bacterium]